MALEVNDSGTWKEAQEVHVNDGGTWKEAQEVWVNDNGTWKQVFTTSTSSGGSWDLQSLQHTKSTNLNSSFTTIHSIHFKDDGSRLFVTGEYSGTDKIQQFDLPSSWDIGSLNSAGASSFTVRPLGIHIGDNGNKLYWYESANDQIHEENLSTAWDVSTAGGTINTLTIPDLYSREVSLKPDGTMLWATGNQNDRVYQYNLSSPWDISTASSDGYVGTSTNSAQGPHWKPDGTKFYLGDQQFDRIVEFQCSSAWDVNTATLSDTLSIGGTVTRNYGIFWKPDGTRFFVADNNNETIHQYDIV